MTSDSQEIRAEVRAALERKPDADSRWLQAAVAGRRQEVVDVSLRSFHAKYVLPVRRELQKAHETNGRSAARASQPKGTTH